MFQPIVEVLNWDVGHEIFHQLNPTLGVDLDVINPSYGQSLETMFA